MAEKLGWFLGIRDTPGISRLEACTCRGVYDREERTVEQENINREMKSTGYGYFYIW
jgi:hypothetical protein